MARFLVNDGNEIVIDRDRSAGDIDISLFTINTPIGALLYQRGFLPMHASAIEVNGGCVIFTGVSGVGKSTILASFTMQTSIGKHTIVKRISRPDAKINIDLLREFIIRDLEKG